MNKFTPDNLIEYNYLLISSTTLQSLSYIDLFFWKKGVLIFLHGIYLPKILGYILFATSHILPRNRILSSQLFC